LLKFAGPRATPKRARLAGPCSILLKFTGRRAAGDGAAASPNSSILLKFAGPRAVGEASLLRPILQYRFDVYWTALGRLRRLQYFSEVYLTARDGTADA
jgi:hypothetical protein